MTLATGRCAIADRLEREQPERLSLHLAQCRRCLLPSTGHLVATYAPGSTGEVRWSTVPPSLSPGRSGSPERLFSALLMWALVALLSALALPTCEPEPVFVGGAP